MMRFYVSKPFPLTAGPNDARQWRKTFWTIVENNEPGLSVACGCYVFAIRFGDNFTPWYVGKTEQQSFKTRVLSNTHFCKELLNKPGALHIFLVSALTTSGRYMSPRQSNAISRLEFMLIDLALQKNPQLYNIQQATMLKKMIVPGIINSDPGHPSTSVKQFKKALGL